MSSRDSGFAGGGVGKAPTGSSVPVPERPSTASRNAFGAPAPMAKPPLGVPLFGGGGPPPGTAMKGSGGGPPGTAYKRLGTASGRPDTGQQGSGAVASSMSSVQIQSRPITNHGISGIKLASTSVGRQVLDKTYFLNELRQKRMEVAAEITKMKTEMEALDRRQAQFNSLEKRSTDLTKEVKLLQEALADYNTVLDKVGSQTPVYLIQQENSSLRERNDQQRHRVNDILTERLALEQKTKQAETKIADIQQGLDSRLSGMPPSQRTQYLELSSETQLLQAESRRLEEQVDELDRQLYTSEGELARNPIKQRSLQLQEQIRALTARKYEQQQEEEKGKRSPEELRDEAMAKLKRDNQEVDAIAAQIKELQDHIKRGEERLKRQNGGAVSGGGGGGAGGLGGGGGGGGGGGIGVGGEKTTDPANRQKFEELLSKERDLNNFMDGFPSLKAAKQSEKQSREDAVVALLERITKLQSVASSQLPNQKRFKEMQDELEYKRMQLETTQTTQERLKDELQMRKAELEKIDTLEDKIKAEIEQLQQKQQEITKQMTEFEDVEEVKRRAEASRLRLSKLKTALLRRKDLLKATLAERVLRLQAKKGQLADHNVQANLERLENKLRALMSDVFQISDFVKAKESETNFRPLAQQIGALVEDINAAVKYGAA